MSAGVNKRVLPGFGLSLGFTLVYLSLIVLIPLSAVFLKSSAMTWDEFWSAVTAPRVVASYQLTFGASFLAACINAVFGLLLAWGLTRYTFPGRKIVDALIDLPFALPTAVAGIALTAITPRTAGSAACSIRLGSRLHLARPASSSLSYSSACRSSCAPCSPFLRISKRNSRKLQQASAPIAGQPSNALFSRLYCLH